MNKLRHYQGHHFTAIGLFGGKMKFAKLVALDDIDRHHASVNWVYQRTTESENGHHISLMNKYPTRLLFLNDKCQIIRVV